MKYFILNFSLEGKEIGDFPQIQDFKKGYDSNRRESCSKIGRNFLGKKPDVEIDFDGLEMSKRAKLTDYLSASFLNPLAGLLVCDNLDQFISSLKIAEHISYAVTIYLNGEIISRDYHWKHFIGYYPEMINFPASKFYLDHSEAHYKKLAIKSVEEYIKTQNKVDYKINASKLVLKKNFATEFDVIRIGIVRKETFVTEAIKDEMIAKGFTGLAFEPAEFLLVE